MSSRVNNLWQLATQSETSSFEKPWQYPNALQEWLFCNSQRAAFKILLSSSLTFLHLVGTIVDRADFLSNGLTDSELRKSYSSHRMETNLQSLDQMSCSLLYGSNHLFSKSLAHLPHSVPTSDHKNIIECLKTGHLFQPYQCFLMKIEKASRRTIHYNIANIRKIYSHTEGRSSNGNTL